MLVEAYKELKPLSFMTPTEEATNVCIYWGLLATLRRESQLDHNQSLKLINEALEKALDLDKREMKTKMLADMYFEKALILRELGGPNLILSNAFNVHAYQCFNSAYTIYAKQTDEKIIKDCKQHMDLCQSQIEALGENDFIRAKVSFYGKFDNDFLGLKKVELRATTSFNKGPKDPFYWLRVAVAVAAVGMAGMVYLNVRKK